MRRSLLLLALLAAPALLASPAMAKPKKEKTEAASTAPVATPAATKDEKAREAARITAFELYEQELATGQKARAADALVTLLDDPANVDFYAEAYGKLGELFLSFDLNYAALCAFMRAFEAATDTDVAQIGLHVPKAMELAKKVGDPAMLQVPFSKNLGLARTEDVRGEMAYLAAREAFRKDSFGLALGMLKIVREGDPVYPDAKALEGVVLNQQGRAEAALIPFESAKKAGREKGIRFLDMVSLNTARSYFGAGNFPRAIQGYAAVTRASEFWPQAQFERAWAHFRIDDLNGTLAVLYSLNTPFFQDYYYPEADLLRVYAMFMMCKFPEANKEIEAFRTHYTPVHENLRAWSARSEKDNFDAARTFSEKGDTSGLPKMILRPYATEDRLQAAIFAVRSAEDELDRMKAVAANPFTERARQWITERRDQLVNEEGGRVKEDIAAQERDIGQMLADTEIFILDILRMKAQLYEQAANTGKMEQAARTVERTERSRKGWREWPFEGEIWADELGYYRVDAVPECPASMRREVPKE